jgi:hypothetical protein
MPTAAMQPPEPIRKTARGGNRRAGSALKRWTMPEPAMEDDRITRIARALCRSARIDPDSILASERLDSDTARDARKPRPADDAVPAWTMFRGAALTFIHSHDERIVSPL